MRSDDDPARPTTRGGDDARPALVDDAAAGSPQGQAPGGGPVTTRYRDGRSWQIGTAADVAWIARGRVPGSTVRSAIPPVFAAYATVVVPELGQALDVHELLVVRLLADHGTGSDWWLGYLDTGASDIVFPDAPRVRVYDGWPCVLVKAGPEQALRWRAEPSPLHCGLPDLMFPTDRSWLISALWDDEWWCLGGSPQLVDAFVREPGLDVRALTPYDDTSPPRDGAT